MAQAGYTPISLYFSTTAAAVPVNTNLANGELAINITDGKLYYKDNGGTVRLLASNATSAPVLSFSAGTTGFTPNTATSGAITLAGTLATTNGGTGLTSFTANGVVYASSSSALATGSALTFDGTNLETTGRLILRTTASPSFAGQIGYSASGGSYIWAKAGTTGSQDNFFIFDDGGNPAYSINSSRSHIWSVSGSEGMRLTSTGLGIGTSSPSCSLDVQKAAGANFVATFQNTTAATPYGVFIKDAASSSAGYPLFAVTDSTGASTYLRVDSSNGNVGIGTAPTTTKLSITNSNATYSLTQNIFNASAGNLWIGQAPAATYFSVDNFALAFCTGSNGGVAGTSVPTNERFRIASNGAWGLSGANYGTSGQVLTSGGSGAAPTWTTVGGGGGGSPATPTVSGTVFGTTSGSSNVGIGYAALVSITSGTGNTAVGYNAGDDITSGTQNTIVGYGAYGGVSTASYNSAFGYQALAINTSGSQNAAFGWLALQKNTTGGGNVSLGAYSMHENASGGNNTAIGFEALGTTTNSGGDVAIGYQALALANPAVSGYGGANVAVGYRALYSAGTVAGNSTGGCTAVGYQAGYSVASAGNGAVNTFIGQNSGYNTNSGYGNTFVGASSGSGNTSGYNSVCIGYNSGRQTAGSGGANLVAVGVGAGGSNSGNDNTFVGQGAGNANTSQSANAYFGTYAGLSCQGSNNTALGQAAMYSSTFTSNNVAVGTETLRSMTSASGSHVAVGYQALYSATDNANTALGYQAGRGVTSGHSNVLIGSSVANTTVVLTGGAQNVVIGSSAYTNTAGAYNEIVIGQSCNGTGNDRVTLGKLNSRVSCQYDTNATWTQSSDVRLKTDIESDSLGLSFINKLRPVKYRWKATNELELDNPHYNEVNNKNTTAVMHGLIAQEVKAALDAENVSTFGGWDIEPNGIQGISREMFITPLINAIQELTAQIETLKAEVAALKGNV